MHVQINNVMWRRNDICSTLKIVRDEMIYVDGDDLAQVTFENDSKLNFLVII